MNLGGLTNGVKFTSGGGISNTFTLPSATGYTFTFPNATGTLALTSDIPVNPITGTGTSGQVAYFNGTSSLTSNAAFAFTPTSQLLVNNSVTAASAIARGTNLTPTLTAAANNDVLVGLDINPTFTNGAFTGVNNVGLRVNTGNVGIGVTPSRWSGGQVALQILNASLSGFGEGAWVIANAFYDGTNKYITSSYASQYRQVSGIHSWHIAPIGVAGNTITYNQAMTLFSTGNLALNTTTDAGFRLDVNGTARVQGNTTVSLNQNANTNLNVFNTTAGNQSRAEIVTTSDANSGIFSFGKYSSTTTAFKTVTSGSAYLYNGVTAGNISILNDFASGNIKSMRSSCT
jgi:hypothetical protein